MSGVDYLIEDSIVPQNQKYCFLSIWLNDDKSKITAFKVSGLFRYFNEAEYQINLVKQKGHLNFVAEVGKWNALEPTRLNDDNLEFELNAMMKRNIENQALNTIEYELRKNEMIMKNFKGNMDEKYAELKTVNDESYKEKIKEQIKSLQEQYNKFEKLFKDYSIQKDNFMKNKTTQKELSIKKTTSQPVIERTDNDFTNKTNEIVDGQNYFCVSFLSEDGNPLVGIKISGAFKTDEEAQTFADSLRNINDSVNVFVGVMYKWMPFNPSPDTEEAGESEYSNPLLNQTMKEKRNNEQKAKIYNEYRKNEEIKNNITNMIQSIKSDESMKERNDIDEKIKMLEEKLKEFTAKEEELQNQLKEMTSTQVPNTSLFENGNVEVKENTSKTLVI